MNDQLTAHLTAARDELTTTIANWDEQEIVLRGLLDEVLGERTRHLALLVDLEHLLAAHVDVAASTNEMSAALAAPPPAATPLVPPAPAEPPAKRRGGRQSTLDLDEIARIANDAVAAGGAALPALIAHYRKPATTVKNWLQKARAAGLLTTATPAAAAVPSPPKTGRKHPDLNKVAATFVEACKADKKPIQSIMDRFDIDRPTATDLVAQCRADGLLPPKGEPVAPGEAPLRFVSHKTTGGV